MTEVITAIEKLRRIEELWEKLKGVKRNTLEYAALTKQIGALSAEYQDLVEAAGKPKQAVT
jgi:hypothetical protein